MLAESLLNVFFNLVYSFLGTLPFINFEIPVGAVDACISVLEFAVFFLPMSTISTMVGIILMEEMFKISLSFIKLVWKFIPIIGN